MITVIDTMEEYSRVRKILDERGSDAVMLFMPSDPKAHWKYNRITLAYYSTPEEQWIMGHHHNDLPKMGKVMYGAPNCLSMDASFFGRFRFIKYDTSYFMDEPHFDQHYTRDQRAYHRKFHNIKNVNDAIPLNMHIRMFRELESKVRLAWESNNEGWFAANHFYSNTIHHVLGEIESSGVAVSPKLFTEAFAAAQDCQDTADGYVDTKYNPYTVTGRPSNSWGGVNFAALPKKTGARKAFVSRFGTSGRLVNFDFKSFHLYLLANFIGVDLPSDDVHTWLGKRYFGVDSLTPEQYEKSKVKTFGLIYGSHSIPTDSGLELFVKIQDLRSRLWYNYQQQGFIFSAIHHRPIVVDLPSENKVFNYWVQNLETEVMIEMMQEMFSALSTITAKPVLYTYDSVLFDCSEHDVGRLMNHVLEVCRSFGYPVNVEVGNNYDEMQKYILT